jgi:hypothetical protein
MADFVESGEWRVENWDPVVSGEKFLLRFSPAAELKLLPYLGKGVFY